MYRSAQNTQANVGVNRHARGTVALQTGVICNWSFYGRTLSPRRTTPLPRSTIFLSVNNINYCCYTHSLPYSACYYVTSAVYPFAVLLGAWRRDCEGCRYSKACCTVTPSDLNTSSRSFTLQCVPCAILSVSVFVAQYAHVSASLQCLLCAALFVACCLSVCRLFRPTAHVTHFVVS
jgi:hypothetical protein